jgi:tRNA G26 N,N-dimethylase Trm1
MDKNISHIIDESCKKCGIDYKSINPNYITFTNDAQQLVQLYKDLLQIAGKLGEIAQRHDICGLGVVIEKEILKINAIDHDLIRLASKIRKEEKC